MLTAMQLAGYHAASEPSMTRRALPFELAVSNPCTGSWDDMTGTIRQRHCELCKKHVHDVAAMTPLQIELLVAKTGGDLCARLTRRPNGSLVTLEPTASHAHFATLALSVALAIAPAAALAQAAAGTKPTSSQTANPEEALPSTHTAVSGVITDSQGAVVVGSAVTLVRNGITIGSTKTNEAGQFEFAVLPGDYQLQVGAPGFASTSKSLTVSEGSAAVSDVSLTPGIQITVRVTAESLTDSTTMGTMTAYFGPWYKRWAFHIRHPVAYAKYLFHDY
jgi:hypothetical protein